MYANQSIQRPVGINVFGSCLLRAAPDYASLRFSVARVDATPAGAFATVREAATAVRGFLAAAAIADRDVQMSRRDLETAYEGNYQERRFVGYRAHTGFHVFLTDFDRLEAVLQGVVDAGAHAVERVSLQSRRLPALRAEARRGAVAAARRKAEQYAEAGGVRLGALLHLEDVNPDELARRSHMPDVDLAAQDDDPPDAPPSPGSIVIAGAVMACFAAL